MMGTTDRPTQVESMILPPIAHDVRVISIAQFTQGNTPVVWRGPMLHRALQQFLADVYWGDLDVLLLDLPPGTGDVAISVAQLIPGAEILVVTTPQLAAAEVAERAGAIALQTRQRIVGVVENMSGLLLPDGTTMQVFGEGGGRQVAERLSRRSAPTCRCSARCRWIPRWSTAGDAGVPLVLSRRIRPRARSYAASPTRCRAASAGWPVCRWVWTPPAAKAYVAVVQRRGAPPRVIALCAALPVGAASPHRPVRPRQRSVRAAFGWFAADEASARGARAARAGAG